MNYFKQYKNMNTFQKRLLRLKSNRLKNIIINNIGFQMFVAGGGLYFVFWVADYLGMSF